MQKSRAYFHILTCVFWGLLLPAGIASPLDTGHITDNDSLEHATTFAPTSESKGRVRSAVIAPYRSATVPSEVSGIIDTFDFQEGAKIDSGQVVVEISRKRYAALVGALEKKLSSADLTLCLARQKMASKGALLADAWGTRQKVIEAEEDVAIATSNREAAAKELEVARLDLAGCTAKAPFSGYLAARYAEPSEGVERLGRLFSIIDTAKVYAIGNVHEDLLKSYEKGAKSVFTLSSGLRFRGTVDRVSPVITPESRTAKVWVIIDNPKNDLKVGMTGSLEPE